MNLYFDTYKWELSSDTGVCDTHTYNRLIICLWTWSPFLSGFYRHLGDILSYLCFYRKRHVKVSILLSVEKMQWWLFTYPIIWWPESDYKSYPDRKRLMNPYLKCKTKLKLWIFYQFIFINQLVHPNLSLVMNWGIGTLVSYSNESK